MTSSLCLNVFITLACLACVCIENTQSSNTTTTACDNEGDNHQEYNNDDENKRVIVPDVIEELCHCPDHDKTTFLLEDTSGGGSDIAFDTIQKWTKGIHAIINIHSLRNKSRLASVLSDAYVNLQIRTFVVMTSQPLLVMESAELAFNLQKMGLLFAMPHYTQWLFLIRSAELFDTFVADLQRTIFDNVAVLQITATSSLPGKLKTFEIQRAITLEWGADRRRYPNQLHLGMTSSLITCACRLFPNRKFGLNGRRITVHSKQYVPSFTNITFDNSTNAFNYSGMHVQILNTLSQVINFTYTYSPPPQATLNMTWADSKNYVQMGRADLGLNLWPFTMSVIDNVTSTYPVLFDDITGIYLPPPPPHGLEELSTFLLKPFPSIVFAILGGAVIFCSLLYTLMESICLPRIEHRKIEHVGCIGSGSGSGTTIGNGNGSGSCSGSGFGTTIGNGNGSGSGSGFGTTIGNGNGSGSGSGFGTTIGNGNGSSSGNCSGSGNSRGSGSGSGNGSCSCSGSGSGSEYTTTTHKKRLSLTSLATAFSQHICSISLSIMNVASLPDPRLASSRILIGGWCLTMIGFSSFYSSCLTSNMVSDKVSLPFDTYKGLLADDRFKLITGSNESMYLLSLLEESQDEIFQAISEKMTTIPSSKNTTTFALSLVNSMKNYHVGFCYRQLFKFIIVDARNQDDLGDGVPVDKLIYMKQKLIPAPLGFICPPQSQLCEILSVKLITMLETGQIEGFMLQLGETGFRSTYRKKPPSRKIIGVSEIYSLMLVVGCSVAVSLGVLVWECLARVVSRRRKIHDVEE